VAAEYGMDERRELVILVEEVRRFAAGCEVAE
jgi:hypothetical protein